MAFPPDWFHALTGFRERRYDETQQNLEVRDRRLHSKINGKSYVIGTLETPSLAELRARAGAVARQQAGTVKVSAIRGEAGQLHRDRANRHAMFQVASQFNLLEMVGPDITPEAGVACYALDRTQGPACAIAAGAATIYRNYFAPIRDRIGQTADRQIDCLADLGAALDNEDEALWTMTNGYALCSSQGLARINERLKSASETERDTLRSTLRIGLHQGIEVTSADDPQQIVSQSFCSALPVSYGDPPAEAWAAFASLVLEAAYEATMWATVVNRALTASNVVFLTELGGGAFGNDRDWIHSAIRHALAKVAHVDLDVRLVSYGEPDGALRALVADYRRTS